jgi:predicted O-methyltransferase YrrM
MLRRIKRGLKNSISPLFLPAAVQKLRSEAGQLKSNESVVDFAFNFRHHGIRFQPLQVREEIVSFLDLLSQRPPSTVLEVGTDKGGTFFLLTRVAAPDALLLTMDLPAAQSNEYPAWREFLYRAFARERQRIELLREDSHAPPTLEKMRRLLGNRGLDLLFIDGDHSYEGVKKDFEMYSALVTSGGIIAFHDIVPGPEVNVGGVPRFWNEIKQTRRSLEFVKDWNQRGWGIGVLPGN